MRDARSTVGWHGSRSAAGALLWAVEREDRRGGALRMVQVLEPAGSEGDPASAVRAARRGLEAQSAALNDRYPAVDVKAEIRVGDRAVQLAMASGGALLVVGTSADRLPRGHAPRDVAMALANGRDGITVIVPAGPPQQRLGVVAVLGGRGRSARAALFAAEEAAERAEPLTFVRLDGSACRPSDGSPLLRQELVAVEAGFPRLRFVLDERSVRSPLRALHRAEHASLLVLERDRSPEEQASRRLERWLVSRSAGPVAVVRTRSRAADRTVSASPGPAHVAG